MNERDPEWQLARETILPAIRRLMADHTSPLLVAVDGGSGAGKSTLASMIAEVLGAAVVPGDDFYAAEVSDAEWETRPPAVRAADAIDWRRLRAEALEPLLAGKPAKWHAIDWDAGVRPDGTYALCPEVVERAPRAVVVLEGAYSTRPELADLIAWLTSRWRCVTPAWPRARTRGSSSGGMRDGMPPRSITSRTYARGRHSTSS